MVKNVKHGKSLFQNANVSDEYHVPVIKHHRIRKNVLEYMDRSLIELSVKETEGNLKLIETLSP
jgi:hypothetical protein